VGGHLCRFDSPVLGPLDSFLERIRDQIPAVAPLTMLAVMPSIPAEAPRAALAAVCSMLDRPALTLLIEALALSTSTWTTSSSLVVGSHGR